MAYTPDSAKLADLPEDVRKFLSDRQMTGTVAPVMLEDILAGEDWESTRAKLRSDGSAVFQDKDGTERFIAVNFGTDGRVMDMAAAIPRNTGKAIDFVGQVADFQDALNTTSTDRKSAIALFHKIVRADGVSNNAVNKLAALIAPEGSFKVRSVKGQRGKAGDKAGIEFQTALNWWKDNVNARGEEAVISGDRGIAAFILQGARLLFIEGDHIARHQTPTKKIQVPQINKPFSLPMNLQTFSAQHIEIPSGLEGTNYEILYWVPPSKFIQLLQDPKDDNLKRQLATMIPAKVRTELIKNKRYFLDPALLIHIKHRATQIDTFGVSLLEPTMGDIRYKRALDALELTVLTNIMARAVIIKVGSDNEKSVYHKQEVSSARLGLLQRMMRNVGPSATLLWAGPDIEVIEVSAHDALLDIVPRMQAAERRHLMALGLPAVLMIGEGTDGKAAGFAAALGVAAQLSEVQSQYAQALKSLAERIGIDNGYEEVDVVWEWHNNLLEDKAAAAELIIKLFDRGLITPETALEEAGFDYGAEEARQAEAVTKKYKDEPFGPPKSAVTDNPGGIGGGDRNGGGKGRPTRNESGNPDPRNGKETKTPEENK